VGLFRREDGPKKTICGLGASFPLQGSTGFSPVTVMFQRKVHAMGPQAQRDNNHVVNYWRSVMEAILLLVVLHNLPFSCPMKQTPWNSPSESAMASVIP